MSDRELLEMAAKAAGIAYEWLPGCGEALRLTDQNATRIYWNPLRDDADAFRLANFLRLKIYHSDLAVIVEHRRYSWEWMGEMVNEDSGDRNASARRAIVRAAAEIGRDKA